MGIITVAVALFLTLQRRIEQSGNLAVTAQGAL